MQGQEKISSMVFGIDSVAFSPDSKRIITGVNGLAKIWNATNGQELVTVELPDGLSGCDAVAFSQDGGRIVTTSHPLGASLSDWTATVWKDIYPEDRRRPLECDESCGLAF